MCIKAALFTLAIAACSKSSSTPAPVTASTTLAATSGSTVNGTVTFTTVAAGGVEITANIAGLSPGDHAFHIHEKGDCSAPDATSAGDHFNPNSHPHGAPESKERHAGDLGNLSAGPDGKATMKFVMKDIALDGGALSIVGKAFIVHEKHDDFTQPAGNAGGRIACGVIAKQRG